MKIQKDFLEYNLVCNQNTMKRWIDYIGVWTGAMIFNSQGKVLIAQRWIHAKNEVWMWDFPGGAVEFWEHCEDAIKREIREEFGIEIEVTELLTVVNHIIPQEGQHWVWPTYIARYVSWDTSILEPDKISQFMWIDIEKIDREQLTIASKQNMEIYIAKYGDKR